MCYTPFFIVNSVVTVIVSSTNLCYICNPWRNWETYLLLFNMGHMIYALDQFFNVNSIVVSIV